MTIQELLKELKITNRGTTSSQGSYVIDLADSNEWGRINSRLDHSDLLEALDDISFLNIDNGSLIYKYEDEDNYYQLTLLSDFNEDKYQLVVTKIQ